MRRTRHATDRHEHRWHDEHPHSATAVGAVGGDWGNHPTGETCGSSFWTRINQRLHRLWPDNETYVAEMERSIFNVALANQGLNGSGIRYFTNLHSIKETPTMIGACAPPRICRGSGVFSRRKTVRRLRRPR